MDQSSPVMQVTNKSFVVLVKLLLDFQKVGCQVSQGIVRAAFAVYARKYANKYPWRFVAPFLWSKAGV